MVNLVGSATTSGTSRLAALANLAWKRCSGERRSGTSWVFGFLLLAKTPLLSVTLLLKTASLSPRLWLRRSLRHLRKGLSRARGEVECCPGEAREEGRGEEARRPSTWTSMRWMEWSSPPLGGTRCTPSTQQAALLLLHQFERWHLQSHETLPRHAPPETPGTCFLCISYIYCQIAMKTASHVVISTVWVAKPQVANNRYGWYINLRLQVRSALIADARSPPAQGNLRTTLTEIF